VDQALSMLIRQGLVSPPVWPSMVDWWFMQSPHKPHTHNVYPHTHAHTCARTSQLSITWPPIHYSHTLTLTHTHSSHLPLITHTHQPSHRRRLFSTLTWPTSSEFC